MALRRMTVAIAGVSMALMAPPAPLLGGGAGDGPPALGAAAKAIELTFLGNCGFLIQVGDRKVLIDPQKPDAAEPPESRQTLRSVYQAMIAGRAPFDGLEAIFVSHPHDDHLGAREMADLLVAQRGVRLFSTTETRDALRKAAGNSFAAIEARVVVVTPGAGGIGEIDTGGLKATVLDMLHAGAPNLMLTSLSFIMDFGGARVFALSDADPGYAKNLEALTRWSARNESVDLLLSPDVNLRVSPWSPTGPEVVRRLIRPARVVATHVSPADVAESERLVRERFPGALVFRSCLERRTFQ